MEPGMITAETIRQMVTQFYQNVRQDASLGPVFEANIQDEQWPHHLDRMCDFWSSVLLTTGRFCGNPRAVHALIPDITPEHFERWLQLFHRTLETVFDAETAAQIFTRAQRMRLVLQNAACPQGHTGLFSSPAREATGSLYDTTEKRGR